jgi:hypothetical protein
MRGTQGRWLVRLRVEKFRTALAAGPLRRTSRAQARGGAWLDLNSELQRSVCRQVILGPAITKGDRPRTSERSISVSAGPRNHERLKVSGRRSRGNWKRIMPAPSSPLLPSPASISRYIVVAVVRCARPQQRLLPTRAEKPSLRRWFSQVARSTHPLLRSQPHLRSADRFDTPSVDVA